ncbi:Guanine nucleotide-binding protein subunit alpha [Hondaea fermentalgiana]|uniref:Guanine nucleotide-binding protein subunit alpha n=1 Tax=Hondaea fermentalgiana TaxID=2315210 RepID=A0A2R5G5E3_9STRA|nr:Guanine nucleotide-binding protein subunit alpha [Hondaea fermentalgiana]|eukprot:GBG26257.1 Guanine nucleotide-binding protein subunit alpha [Hondaea fermentalgiana]
MGNKMTSEESKSKRLSLSLNKSKAQAQKQIKLLLLGSGESGKSTIFKQMRLIYGAGYPEEECIKLRPFLIGNVIEGAQDIINAGEALGIDITDDRAQEAASLVLGLDDKRAFSDEVVEAILLLWENPEFKNIWEHRSHFQLQDTWHEYVEELRNYPKWGGPDWIPSKDDILKSRVRTTGVVDEEFVVKDIKLRMLDVGGQRNERRKWIHCFEGVTSVIFVTSLSEYDQVLFEDASKNRLEESLELFNEIINSEWFVTSAMILFLNKSDLFTEKFIVRGIPLNESGLFPDAPVERDFDAAIEWFSERFKGECLDPQREIYAHVTCATDTQKVDTVMRTSSQHVLRMNLRGSGVLM